MDTRPITLDMQNQIERIRLENGGIASPFSFASLYIWRDIVGDRIHLEEELFSLRYDAAASEDPKKDYDAGESEDPKKDYEAEDNGDLTLSTDKNHGATDLGESNENAWIFPCGSDEAKRRFITECLSKNHALFYYVREEDKTFLEENFLGRFQITPQDDFDEYIYSLKEQTEIKGDKFHRIRNRINKLSKEHDLRTEILNDDNLSDAISVIENWARDKEIVGNLGTRGDEVDEDALKMHKELKITGVIIYDGTKPISVAAGFYMSEDIYDVFLCKGAERIPGLFYHTRRELLKTLNESCMRVDLEDDMGLEGLRTMKEELHPIDKIKMWKAISV